MASYVPKERAPVGDRRYLANRQAPLTRTRRPRDNPVFDRFAELFAAETCPEEAAAALGYPRAYGREPLKKLRARLVWQAR